MGERLSELQTGSPDRLRARHFVQVEAEDAFTVEALCHQALADWRRTGEWFDVSVAQAVGILEIIAEPYVAARMRSMYELRGGKAQVVEGYDCTPWAPLALTLYHVLARTDVLCGTGLNSVAEQEDLVLRRVGKRGLAALRLVHVNGKPLELAVQDPNALRMARSSLRRAVNAVAEHYILSREGEAAAELLAA